MFYKNKRRRGRLQYLINFFYQIHNILENMQKNCDIFDTSFLKIIDS